MSIFVTRAEVERLRQASPDSRQQRFYQALLARTHKNTRVPGFLQPGDTQQWWHLCWERASDAAFVYHVEKDAALGEWLRGIALWMAELPADEWIGPWFRKREQPLKGMLETAHVSLALCEILDLAGDLFTPEEDAALRAALYEKGLKPCERYCAAGAQGSRVNNWFSVLLCGYGVSAAVLGEAEHVRQTLAWLPIVHNLYNDDSYGESLQYSNYASLCLANLQEVLLRSHPECAPQLNLRCYARLMPWYAASYLYQKPLREGGPAYPRAFNFSDSAAVFRPSGDVLAQVACRMAKELPREAALATWLLDATYADPTLGPDERATFGFFNQFQYHTITLPLLADIAEPASPEALGYPEVMEFEYGHVLLRDCWENPRAQMAIQAGYASQNVTSHRHQDHLSFQMAVGRERMLVDAGHCCYRLAAWRFSISSSQHNLFDFVLPDGTVLGQKVAAGNFAQRQAPLVRNLLRMRIGTAEVTVADGTDAYGPEITRAVRAFVSVLPHACFIIDRATTAKPVTMRSHFAANNRDNRLSVNRADDHRLVFRRNGEAMKLFECAAWLDGQRTPSALRLDWGYVHDCYHPLPNQEGQGKEGSALIYSWDSPVCGTEHLRVYAMAMDADSAIRGWHIKPEDAGGFRIESPDKAPVLRIRVRETDGSVFLVDGRGETLLIS